MKKKNKILDNSTTFCTTGSKSVPMWWSNYILSPYRGISWSMINTVLIFKVNVYVLVITMLWLNEYEDYQFTAMIPLLEVEAYLTWVLLISFVATCVDLAIRKLTYLAWKLNGWLHEEGCL